MDWFLWYFNFVQIPNMPKIPDEQKPAIGKVIAPAALFYFRWAALLTVLSGLILAYLNGYLHDAMTLGGGGKNTAIGIGMWLGLYMAFNVWFIIWPNQKRALGMVECEPDVKSKISKNSNVVFKNKYSFIVTNVTFNGSSSKSLLNLLCIFF